MKVRRLADTLSLRKVSADKSASAQNLNVRLVRNTAKVLNKGLLF